MKYEKYKIFCTDKVHGWIYKLVDLKWLDIRYCFKFITRKCLLFWEQNPQNSYVPCVNKFYI